MPTAIPTAAVSTYDPLYDETGAAAFLHISPATLRKWRCLGGGPEFVKLGRCVRYPQSSLEVFVRARVKASTSASAAAR